MVRGVITPSAENQFFVDMLNQLEKGSIGIGKMAVYDGAHVIAAEVKAAVLSKHIGIGSKYGNGLLQSIGIATIRVGTDIDTVVGFDGYDYKNTPELLKARTLNMKDRFFTSAVSKINSSAGNAMANRIDIEINKRTK